MWAGALSILILSLIAALRLFGDQLYNFPNNPEITAIPQDSVIICLAGGKFRVEAAYSLYSQGVGERLLIIGAGKKSTAMGLARAHASEAAQSIPQGRFEKIQVETDSNNTIENAFAVARLLEQSPNVKNLVLVTSGFHMRRAQVMIQSQVDRNINIIPFIPPSDVLNKVNWWHSWIGIQVTTVEYMKFLLASLFVPQLNYL